MKGRDKGADQLDNYLSFNLIFAAALKRQGVT